LIFNFFLYSAIRIRQSSFTNNDPII